MGGITGAFFAFLSLSALRHVTAVELPRISEVQFDGAVLAFAAALTLVTGILFGLAPSLTAARIDLMTVLRRSQSGPVRVRLRSVLVASQIALSVVLLIGTALLMETILKLRGEPLGFDSTNVLTARVALPPHANPASFFHDVLQRVRAVPGVEHASASLSLPMTSYPGTPVQNAQEPALPLNQRSLAAIFIVTPDYFATLRIPLIRGRTFTEHDREGTRRVAVIDENLARHFWPDYPAGQNPVGQYLRVGGVNKEPAEIIGIVANAHQDLESTGWNRGVYVAFAQSPLPSAMLALRVRNNPMSFTGALRNAVQAVSPSQPVSNLESMQDLVEAQLGSRRLLMRLLAFFGLVTVCLVLVGIYGLVSYSVTQRTRELGIRLAIGAPESSVLRMIVTQACRLALSGVLAGTMIAYAVTRLMRSYLFHTSATDPAAFCGVALLFVLATAAAAFGPALRAARTDPVRALRYE